MKKNSLVILALASSTIPAAGAFVFAGFEGGSGNSSADQYVGAAAEGWAGPWQDASRVDNNTTFSLNGTTPITGSFSLQGSSLDTTSGGASRTNIAREFNAAVGAIYTVTFDFRLDTWTTFNQFGDFITFFAQGSYSNVANFNDSAWGFRIAGSNAFQVRGGDVNTTLNAISVSAGDSFSINMTVNTTAQLYDITVINSTQGETQTLTDVAFNADYSAIAPNFFHTGTSTQSDGVNPVAIAYSLDNLSIVPEPSTSTLIAGLLGLSLSRRKR